MFGQSNKRGNYSNQGFTIVELLVVIVVIGILAAISIVSYTGITKKANETTVKAELTNASKKLAIYFAQNDTYPTNDLVSNNGCPLTPVADTQNCVKFDSDTSYTYVFKTASTYDLTATKGTVSYKISDGGAPQVALAESSTCPTGFIVVPGSSTYGTSDFCVMKYEAKADDNGDGIGDTNQATYSKTWLADVDPISASRKLVSTPEGYPVADISQTTAITAASAYTTGCASGCHLVTEAEWMTIAQNVLSVASNWSGGAVGSGYIYSGHNDGTPNNAIVADVSDTNGYANTGQTSGNQRRTLTLTNGEVIWDLAGNVYEWTTGQTTGGQPGITSGLRDFREYPAITNNGSLAVNPKPSGTNIAGSASWTSINGIGVIYSDADDVALRGFLRGGAWTGFNFAGVLTLALGNAPSYEYIDVGFRVSR